MTLTGRTRLYAIVGDPIAQARSPQVFTEAFAAAGADAILVPAHIDAAAFDTVFPALLALRNLDGLLVTVPFKPQAIRYATRVDDTAACVGAVNALRREADGTWAGAMFDGAGFVEAARRNGATLGGRRALVFGAGGAGSAVACALAEAGVASVDLADPAQGRAAALAERLRTAFPACAFGVAAARGPRHDLVVNASTVGMRPDDGLPGDVGTLGPGVVVGDAALADAPTALLRRAREAGCTTVTGREMHAGQAQAIVDFFAPRLRGG